MKETMAQILRKWEERDLSPGPLTRLGWYRLKNLPGGKRLFSRLIGRYAPYSGNINAQVEDLGSGFAKIILNERQAVRNHLRSIHAIALANLAELTGNLALCYSLPPRSRFIVTQMKINYHKKARGRVIALARCPVPSHSARQTYSVHVRIENQQGELLCEAEFESLVGPL